MQGEPHWLYPPGPLSPPLEGPVNVTNAATPCCCCCCCCWACDIWVTCAFVMVLAGLMPVMWSPLAAADAKYALLKGVVPDSDASMRLPTAGWSATGAGGEAMGAGCTQEPSAES